MKTLELKDIIGYLPYKLNFINISGSEEDDTIYTLKGLSTYHGAEYELSEGQYSCVGIEHIVTILRPLSDLEKPIKVEGCDNEEFNPALEIAKLCIPFKRWSVDEKTKKIQHKKIPYYTHLSKIHRIYFKFYKAVFIRYNDKGILDEVPLPFEVINLLHQWHFDIYDLIEKGLAIDINTLK